MVKVVQVAAASSYALTSVLILLFNKIILTTYSFKYPFLMSLSHMSVSLLLLWLLKTFRIINYAPFDINLAKKALPVSLCFIANCVLGMIALKGTNIPMFATLRRLTIMMVVACEALVLRKKQSSLVIFSVLVMILGSFIGGWGDMQFDLFGYCMVLLNNLVTALNLVFIKKTLMDTKLATDTFGVLYYNSVLSVPFLLVCAMLSGELYNISDYPYLSDSSFQFSFFLSAAMSFLMNYSTYWCTEVNSALTTSVTGQVKNVMSSFISLSIFGHGVGVQTTPLLLLGLIVGLTGSFMYAYAIFKNDQAKKIANSANASNSLAAVAADANGKSENIKELQMSLVNGHSTKKSVNMPDAHVNVSKSPIEVDEDLSSLTNGVVNHIYSSNGNNQVAAISDEQKDADYDAKLMRVESGLRSPMVPNSFTTNFTSKLSSGALSPSALQGWAFKSKPS